MTLSNSTLSLVRAAYKKLKASAYFDKTVLPLRDALVEFESDNDFSDKLEKIALFLEHGNDEVFLQSILESIEVLAFPKSFKESLLPTPDHNDKELENNVIGLGNSEDYSVVDSIQYFIDMKIEGHILGVLWILLIGWKLDQESCKNSRGNRLRKLLIDELKDNDIWTNGIEENTILFESYFQQYSTWRDEGLCIAQDALKEKQDVVVLTLDLKSYYYSVDITETLFDEIIVEEYPPCSLRIHNSIYQVIKRYSEVLRKLDSVKLDTDRTVLPIGFLPSSILANWALSKLDKGILDYWNPLYYGRYVDDIIIVDKVEKNSDLCQLYVNQQKESGLTKRSVIEYYFMGKRRKSEQFVHYCGSDAGSAKERATISTNYSLDETEYVLDRCYCPSEGSNLVFNNKKIRVLYLSHKNDSESIITLFRKQIMNNISEMRLLPDIADGAYSNNYYGELYWLDNDETINKLRGVKGIAIDKFELSKYLGKYRIVSSLTSDKEVKDFTKTMFKIFGYREIIECYIYWERVFEIFLTDKKYSDLSIFITRIYHAIEILKYPTDLNKENIIKNALRRHLGSTCNRTLSLVWGAKIKSDILDKFYTGTQLDLRRQYISTRMSNKYVMQIPLVTAASYDYSDEPEVSLLDFASFFQFASKLPSKPSQYCFEPYFEKAQDISLDLFIACLLNKDGDANAINNLPTKYPSNENSSDSPFFAYFDELRIDSFRRDGSGVKLPPIRCLTTIQNQKEFSGDSKLSVAVANVSISKIYDLDGILKGRKPDRSQSRYKDMLTIFNTALIEHADLLVLPENFLPFEWLPSLVNKAANEQMAIITGIEHLVLGKSVYNVTAVVLPFKHKDSIPTATVHFQLKKHFAPQEKNIIENYGKRPIEAGDSYERPLYHWRDCYFPVYCCYELTSILERAKYMSYSDMIVAVEYNKDTNYFSNIIESLARDLHCYCIQVNTSEYGDSRITQPTKTETSNIIKVKGGRNATVLVDSLDIRALRESQLLNYNAQDGVTRAQSTTFKSSPVDIDRRIVRKKIEGRPLGSDD